jgi:hypothetical protein
VSDVIAICARRADVEMEPLPGSELRPCFDCGVEVVMSPSTVARKPRWVLCHGCGRALREAHPELELGFSEEAMRDYLELERRSHA